MAGHNQNSINQQAVENIKFIAKGKMVILLSATHLKRSIHLMTKIVFIRLKQIQQGIKNMTTQRIAKCVSRDALGKLFCKGEGLEIGAGCVPTAVALGAIVHYVDKRTPEELKTYFASHDVVNVQSISLLEGKNFDFLMAHHVLEHSANVIQTIIHWMSFIKDGGVLFLCLPNRHITPDASRLLTPPTHFLLDYVNQATEDDFESREHICSFLWGWIDVGGLQDTTKLEAAKRVSNALNSAVNDLHWHTFNIDTLKFVIKMAATFSGRSVEVLFEQDGFQVKDEHRLVCKLVKGDSPVSENINHLIQIRNSLRSVVYNVALEGLDGCATYSLSKEHKGKIFLIDRGRIHWIRSPQTLAERSLGGRDYTYLEIGDMEKNILGPTIGENECLDRRATFKTRLKGLERLPGIELSPGAIPILEKKSFNVTYLDKFDHTNSEDTYLQGPAVSIDLLLGDKLIDEVLEPNKFFYLVSSHVIEHIPDFIQFFKSADNVLKSGARLIMFVPDKRYTFDVLRSTTSISVIEEAHNQRLRYPSRSMARDVYANSDFNASVKEIWDQTYIAAPTHDSKEALRIANEIDLSKADLHCYTFTPGSLRSLINHVIAKHVPEFQVLEITDTPYGHNEFIIDMILHK